VVLSLFYTREEAFRGVVKPVLYPRMVLWVWFKPGLYPGMGPPPYPGMPPGYLRGTLTMPFQVLFTGLQAGL